MQPARTILIANPKGGSGKSTVAINLAGALARRGQRVCLGDLDRQRSALSWLGLRAPFLPPIEGWEPSTGDSPPAGMDWIVLDSPAGLNAPALKELLKHVDRLLVPIQPSPIDFRAADTFFAELVELKRMRAGRIPVGLIGVRVDPRTLAARELERFVATLGLPLLGHLRATQLYVQTAAHGLSVFDLSVSRAATDHEQWRPLLDWLDPTP